MSGYGITNLSPARIAIVGGTYAEAWFHMREMNVKPSDGYVAVSLSGHPGSIAGMKFREVIYVGSHHENGKPEMVHMVNLCAARYEQCRGDQ